MRRLLLVGAVIGGAVLLRIRLPRLRENMLAKCEAMFEHMPDEFPPKRMMRGIEEVRANTARIIRFSLLEGRAADADDPTLSTIATDASIHAA
jgi:hypothetical protein